MKHTLWIVAICLVLPFSLRAQTTNAPAATNAPAGTNATAAAAQPAAAQPAGPVTELTGRVLVLRDAKGELASIKLLTQSAVIFVALDDKSREMAKEAKFKNVKVSGVMTEEKPEGATAVRKTITVQSYMQTDPDAVPKIEKKAASTNQPPAAATNEPPVEKKQ